MFFPTYKNWIRKNTAISILCEYIWCDASEMLCIPHVSLDLAKSANRRHSSEVCRCINENGACLEIVYDYGNAASAC